MLRSLVGSEMCIRDSPPGVIDDLERARPAVRPVRRPLVRHETFEPAAACPTVADGRVRDISGEVAERERGGVIGEEPVGPADIRLSARDSDGVDCDRHYGVGSC